MTRVWRISEVLTPTFPNDIITEIMSQNNYSVEEIDRVIRLAVPYLNRLSIADYSFIGRYETAEKCAQIIGILLQLRFDMIAKYGMLFKDSTLINTDRYKKQTFTDTIEYKNKETTTYDREDTHTKDTTITNNGLTENAPITEAIDDIDTPNSKAKTVNTGKDDITITKGGTETKDSEDLTNKETIENIETEHNPIEELAMFKEINNSLLKIVMEWINTVILEFNVII